MLRQVDPIQVQNENDVKEWLNSHASSELIKRIEMQIASEARERLFKNPGSSIDYGYSFPKLNDIRHACLKEVRNFYTVTGKRPHVADIGAGFGNMTWKLLAAGGQVDAFEVQVPTAQELSKRLNNMDTSFWENACLEDILHVFADNVLSVLEDAKFSEKYDFIWLGNVIHLLTPLDLDMLNQIFQRVLKTDGKIFAETNTFLGFASVPKYSILEAAYERAKQKGLVSPCFFGINTATLISDTIDKVLTYTFVSALDAEEMELHSIPYQTNTYGNDYLAPSKEALGIDKQFQRSRNDYPDHKISINRFHQVMNLFDQATAINTFTLAGFQTVDSFYYQGTGGCRVPQPSKMEPCGLALVFKKPGNLLSAFSILNIDPSRQILLDAEAICKSKTGCESYLEAIKKGDFSLALRRACAIGSVSLVQIILKYKTNLNIDLNVPSTSNGYTALDWIKNANNVHQVTRDAIINILLSHQAKYGSELSKPETSLQNSF